MRRALALLAGLAAVLAVAVGSTTAATPRVQIAQVDTSRYPLITATVIAPGSDKLPPRFTSKWCCVLVPSPNGIWALTCPPDT